MTREEAVKLSNEWSYGDEWTVNEIYDYFENKICSTCKYHIVNADESLMWCTNEDGVNKYIEFDLIVSEDFGCNKWESK